jgi:hypothetical protein
MKRILLCLTLACCTPGAGASESARYNFRISPIGLLVGAVGFDFDIQVAPDWTIGPHATYWHYRLESNTSYFTDKYDVRAFGFGVRANWFKNGAYTDGLYIGPSLFFASTKVTNNDAFGEWSGTSSGLFATGLVGYGWFWENFNIMLGGGATFGLGDTKVTVMDSSGQSTEVSSDIAGLALEFSLGWTF